MKKFFLINLWGVLLLAMSLLLEMPEITMAETVPVNAVQMWEDMEGLESKAKFYDNAIYFVTRGKLASSNERRRYSTQAWRITVRDSITGNTLYVEIKRSGKYQTNVDPEHIEGKYLYNLYKVDYKDISMLMSNKYGDKWVEMSSTRSNLTITFDAIMTYKQGGSDNPVSYVTAENDDGTVEFSDESMVYNLGIESERTAFQKLFPSTNFKPHYNINQNLRNPTLTIYYIAALEGITVDGAGNGYKVDNELKYITRNNDKYSQQTRRFSYIDGSNDALKLKSPDFFGLEKKGYTAANWINKDGTKMFYDTKNYIASDFTEITNKNVTVDLYANWQPNTYYVEYNRGLYGSGTHYQETAKYDTLFEVDNCLFTSETHDFSHWTYVDENGETQILRAGDSASNLTSVNEETVVLTAQWTPKVYKITIDKGTGIGGTDYFYEIHGNKFVAEKNSTTVMKSIISPDAPTGYVFAGIYASKTLRDVLITDQNGVIEAETNYFKSDRTVYAHYDPKHYTVNFNFEGGKLGTESTVVTYDAQLPDGLTPPTRTGYTFAGYFTERDGKGTKYYNEYMSSSMLYQIDGNLMLYAYWIDNLDPIGKIFIPDNWTNSEKGIAIKAQVQDFGVGLQAVKLYMEDATGDVLVAEALDLNGITSVVELGSDTNYGGLYTHTKEGVYTYRLEIWDMNMNVTETSVKIYKNAMYDITAPSGYIITEDTDLSDLTDLDIFIYVTDFKDGQN